MKMAVQRILAAALFLVFSQQVRSQSCHPKFQAIEEHSACLPDSPDLTASGVSPSDIDAIVDLHNSIRSEVIPIASNMQAMAWDEEIATVAQQWANTCPPDLHDESLARSVPGRFSGVGQNTATGYSTWNQAILAWESEYADFTYGEAPATGVAVGHYTQMVWATSSKIGCGYAECSGNRRFYICNYGPSGNGGLFTDPFARYKPYERGDSSCADCPISCLDNLCDCEGIACYNGGTLDPNTCTCTCLHPDYHTGDVCDLDCSQADDSYFCESKGGANPIYTEQSCAQFVNVPDECPSMCNFCPAGGIDFVVTTTGAPETTTVEATAIPGTCECASVLVSGPTELADLLGIYRLQDCLRQGRDVFVHNNGLTYLFYDDLDGFWKLASELEAGDVYTRVDDAAQQPHDVTGTWQVSSNDRNTWVDADELRVECMCDEPIEACSTVNIESSNIAHTFPGVFVYNGTVNDRPYYQNTRHGLFLYFHEAETCSFWGIAPDLTSSGQWVMHVYDISAQAHHVSATWRVGGQAGWQEDESLKVVCV